MTAPSGPSNFEYSDDSVVARVAFDIPPQALTDVTQLTQAFSALATQQEYIARSTGSWLDYMNQVPQIMERANQSYRESITQLERMAYIQNEMGGGQSNIGPSTGASAGGYSTAAPQGYINPFQGMQFGMGAITPDLTSAQQHMSMMASQNPQMYANMMGARGMAVNPALLGMVGGTVAGATGQGGIGGNGGGQGWGNSAPGSSSPQATQASRDSAAPPDPAQGGATTRSEPQNIPAQPHEDAPPWQQTVASTIGGAQQILNETKAGGGGRASSMLGLAAAGMTAAGKWSANNPNALGGFSGRLGSVAKGAGLVGLAAAGMNVAQNVGEQVQQYQQLGSVQGGDYQTGIKYEAQARMLALNPFITTEQARTAMQMALSQGFQGGEYDTIQDYMLANFKDLGVQFSTSMSLAKTALASGEGMDQATQGNRSLLETMSQLSQDGGASFPVRQQQAVELNERLTGMGYSAESARRATLGFQEGYGDNMALRDSISRIGGDVASSPLLTQMAAQQAGIGGNFLPGAQKAALSEAGIDADQMTEMAAGQVAKLVEGYPNRLNRIAAFQTLMGQQGVQMDWNEAEAMYDKVTGDKKPSQVANENVAKKAEGRSNIDWNPFSYIGKVLSPTMNAKSLDDFKNIPTDTWNAIRGWEENSDVKDERDNFAKSGRSPADPPKTAQQAQQSATVQTQGTVQGEVRITVDQQGRVSAPQAIQLSGQQKSANAGYGSAQLNNAPPGDPSFGHSYNGWGGGE